jgi:hypothetical protein
MDQIFVHKESMGLNIYPNPMVSRGNIEVILPVPGDLSINILDAAGRQVMEHLEQGLPEGPYMHSFNAENLSRGIYYVKVKSGNRINIRKIIRQ